MTRAIATVSMSGSLTDKLRAAAAAGYDGVELFENDLVYFPGTAEEVRQLAGELGLRIVALQPVRDIEGLAGEERERAFARAARKFDLARRLGTDLVMVCSQTRADSSGDRETIVRDLRELAERAAAAGLRVGYEALAWGRHVSDWRDARDIVLAVDRPNFGLVLDTFHMLVPKYPVDPVSGLDPRRIFLVQLADAPAIAMDPLFLSRHHRCFPGQGDLPVGEVVRRLRAIGYEGPWSHEIFSDDFRSGSAQQAATDGMRSFLFLDERCGLPVLPEAPRLGGFGFVEFVEAAERADAFRDILRALGFARTHAHRSKLVELWTQGDIRLVLDLADEGFPHAFQLLHGLSVSALALWTDDGVRAAERARRLLATPFRGPVGEGELEIPAVRGVAGSLLYFLTRPPAAPSFVEQDFRPVPHPAGEDIGLERVDHVAQVVPPAEFASWLLFYRTVLGLEPEPRIDLADPRGAITSRALSDAARSVRIALNTSPSQVSAAGRFLARTAGAGAQHLAFACRDVVKAAAALPVDLRLPIPDNYYEDLEARGLLPPERVDELRRHGILYDAGPEGEFLHLYTRSVNGLFFELVERRGGYDRYGEANAPVRLAAQAELDRSPSEALTLMRGG
jgi:4-hydroxyphenylpyruvate dioxygenase